MSLGIVLIMLGAILPDLKADYALSYQVGGSLLSVQSVGYVLAGLLAGYLPLLIFAGLMIAMAVVNAAMQRKPEVFIQEKTNSVVSL